MGCRESDPRWRLNAPVVGAPVSTDRERIVGWCATSERQGRLAGSCARDSVGTLPLAANLTKQRFLPRGAAAKSTVELNRPVRGGAERGSWTFNATELVLGANAADRTARWRAGRRRGEPECPGARRHAPVRHPLGGAAATPPACPDAARLGATGKHGAAGTPTGGRVGRSHSGGALDRLDRCSRRSRPCPHIGQARATGSTTNSATATPAGVRGPPDASALVVRSCTMTPRAVVSLAAPARRASGAAWSARMARARSSSGRLVGLRRP